MICGACGADAATAPCAACGADPLLAGRYRLDAVIGQGGAGVTYRAARVADEHVVCVKELAFHALRSFDAERLFRREAAVLRQLHHAQIPAYLDDFSAGEGKHIALYLVQELVDGENLAAELAGHRYTEREVLAVLDELLTILVYLHGLAPPVIHRDLKPSNILRRRDDGRLVLVDFGAVKDTVANSVSAGSTVAGTFGYMAPEQLYGQATAASDLYAVGVLAVVLLSRREPAELIDREQQLAWHDHVRASAPTRALLDRLTRRDPSERPADARAVQGLVRAALTALDRVATEVTSAPSRPRPPHPPRPPRPIDFEPTVARGAARDPEAPVARAVWPGSAPAARTSNGWSDDEAPAPADAAALPPAARRLRAVVLALLVISLVIGAVTLFSTVNLSEVPLAASAAAPPCPGGTCAPLSEPFLDKLRFGMSVAEARAARPDLAAGSVAHDDATVSDVVLDLAPGYVGEPARDELTAGVLLEDEPARCVLGFPVGLGLQRVACVVELPGQDGTAYATGFQRDLTTRYGVADPETRARYLPGPEVARWRSSEGTLTLERRGPIGDFAPAKVTVVQQASAWAAAAERAQEVAAQRAAARAAEREAEQKAARDAERARLEALQAGEAAP